jgi:hypothetical protein
LLAERHPRNGAKSAQKSLCLDVAAAGMRPTMMIIEVTRSALAATTTRTLSLADLLDREVLVPDEADFHHFSYLRSDSVRHVVYLRRISHLHGFEVELNLLVSVGHFVPPEIIRHVASS